MMWLDLLGQIRIEMHWLNVCERICKVLVLHSTED